MQQRHFLGKVSCTACSNARSSAISATPTTLSPEVAAFVAAVDEAYQSADADRLMIERSLD